MLSSRTEERISKEVAEEYTERLLAYDKWAIAVKGIEFFPDDRVVFDYRVEYADGGKMGNSKFTFVTTRIE